MYVIYANRIEQKAEEISVKHYVVYIRFQYMRSINNEKGFLFGLAGLEILVVGLVVLCVLCQHAENASYVIKLNEIFIMYTLH